MYTVNCLLDLHTCMSPTPTFANPPIVEFVLGAQFSPLTKLSSAHFGRFWNALGSEWINPRDAPLIVDQFERFDDESVGPRKWQFKLEQGPLVNRLTLINRESNRLLQVQPTRLHLNWRKTNDFKPSYKDLIGEFEKMFARFVQFCDAENIGDVDVNQWEVTYVDCFPKGDYWTEPSEWGQFLPGLFRVEPLAVNEQLELERRAAEWSFEIKPKLGRLHVSASIGQWNHDQTDALMLNITARGPLRPGYTNTLKSGLDLGHAIAVDQFLRMVSDETKQKWGLKDE